MKEEEDTTSLLGSPPESSTQQSSSRRRSSLSMSVFVILTMLSLNVVTVARLKSLMIGTSSSCTSDVADSRLANETMIPLFGHAHMAKTAGSEINTVLASRYERVCGNKASSAWVGEQIRRSRKHPSSEIMYISSHKLGYDDCDYISMEDRANRWNSLAATMGPMEIHIPCRDMVEHVLSQCNFLDRTFHCYENITRLHEQVDACLIQMYRFPAAHPIIPNVTFKCFNPIPVQAYVEYMGQFLQKRKRPVPYHHFEMNRPRNKSIECLQTNALAQARVRKYLLQTQPYYRYCEACIGSEDDLLLHWET